MMNIDKQPVFWAAVVALAVSLSACGSAGGGAGSTPSGSSVPVAQAGASTGGVGTRSGCPDASAIPAAAGTTVGTPQVTMQAGTTLCSYPEASGGIIAISDETNAEYAAGDVKNALNSQAQALGGSAGSVTAVPGLGDGAYEFTRSGLTTLGIVSGSAYWSVVGAPGPAAALALARLVL